MAPLMGEGLPVEIVRVNSKCRGIAGYPMPYLIRRIDGQRFDWAADQPPGATRDGGGMEIWAARRHLRRTGEPDCAWERWYIVASRAMLDRWEFEDECSDGDADLDDDENDVDEPTCPYCGAEDECPHYLLFADTSEQRVLGGLLYEAFQERCKELCNAKDERIEGDSWGEAFKAVLSEVERLADAERVQDFEAGPGTASRNLYFYASSESRAGEILQAFIAGGVPPNAPNGTGLKDD